MPNMSENTIDRANLAGEEIVKCLSRYGVKNIVEQSFLAHLLSRAYVTNDLTEISYQDIFEGKLGVNTGTLDVARHALNKALWEKLKKIGERYSPEEVKIAARAIGRKIDDLEAYPDLGPATPSALLRIVEELLDIQPNDKVADMGCGCGSVLEYLSSNHPDSSFCGYDIDSVKADIAENQTWEPHTNIRILRQNVFNLEDEKFDKVFAHFSNGLQKSTVLQRSGYAHMYGNPNYKYFSDAVKEDEWISADFICKHLTANGIAVVVMPYSNLANTPRHSPSLYKWRKELVEKGLVRCVISLPGKIGGLTQKTALVVFSHGNQEVRLIDAVPVFQPTPYSRIVSEDSVDKVIDIIRSNGNDSFNRVLGLDTLRENKYILNPYLYVAKELGNTANAVPFTTVIKRIMRGMRCPLDELQAMETDNSTNIHYVNVSRLNSFVEGGRLPRLSHIPQKLQKYCIKNNSLIFTKNHPIKLAVAVVAEEEKILLGNNLYSIELDEEKIDPFYLLAFFESLKGRTMLQGIAAGSNLNMVGIDKLKALRIPLPPLERQQHIAKKCKQKLEQIARQQEELNRSIDELHKIYTDGGLADEEETP